MKISKHDFLHKVFTDYVWCFKRARTKFKCMQLMCTTEWHNERKRLESERRKINIIMYSVNSHYLETILDRYKECVSTAGWENVFSLIVQHTLPIRSKHNRRARSKQKRKEKYLFFINNPCVALFLVLRSKHSTAFGICRTTNTHIQQPYRDHH